MIFNANLRLRFRGVRGTATLLWINKANKGFLVFNFQVKQTRGSNTFITAAGRYRQVGEK